MKTLIFAAITILLASTVALQWISPEDHIQAYLKQSVPFVGTETPWASGADGDGIVIAVIDTGVDYTHPDLLGWGTDGKVIGGYNFINEDEMPIDTNGHGTQVAGVIAADGQLVGIAPKAKILAYKVSEDGKNVPSELIIRAIDRAVQDDADIINISLGVNKTNSRIDSAVDRALDSGILVITAAGNDGPAASSIGSPGRNHGSITVGATYNNLTSSLVATLDIDGKQYTVIPMAGSSKLDEPILSEIVFAGHASIQDIAGIDAKGKILVAERGSADGEILFFSTKEANAADAGALALVVYNNKPGIFLGELIHEFTDMEYRPRIPVVSIDREEGLEIKNMLKDMREGMLHLFYNPDFVAHFSSRGPVSPFYIKPDMVAPGAYINTTQNNARYNFTSGTSYAAPHVSGAAALLMQKNHDIIHQDIKSLLMTTAKSVSDAYGNQFSSSASGAGRLDIENAFKAELVIQPPSLVANISSFESVMQHELRLKPLQGTLEEMTVSFEGPEFIEFTDALDGNSLIIRLKATGDSYGDHEAKINMNHKGIKYTVPVLIHYTKAMIDAAMQDGKMVFKVGHPEKWSFAKITVTNSLNGKTQITTTTPGNNASVNIHENAKYWIEANVRADQDTHDAFDVITVDLPAGIKGSGPGLADIPERQIGIIAGIVLLVGIAGLVVRQSSLQALGRH